MKKLFCISSLAFPFVSFANFGGDYGMPWGWGMMGGGGGIFSFLSSLIWLIVGIFAAVWLWQHIDRK